MARDVAKLPQWAQERIILLEAQVRYYQAEADKGVLSDDFPQTNLHLAPSNDMTTWSPSRYRAGRIMLGPQWDNFVDFRYEDHAGEPMVHVHSGFGRLSIHPSAGNAIHLTTKR